MDAQALNGNTTAIGQVEIALDALQFRLTRSAHPEAANVGGYWLSHSPDLPVVKVTDRHDRPAGFLLGFPIDLQTSTPIKTCWRVPEGASLHSQEGHNTALLALGGSFLWICLTETCARIYPDVATQFSCVWDSEGGSAGTTTGAILDHDEYLTRFDHAGFRHLRHEGGGWFPAGLTAHSGIRRLLPGHYLDLNTWSAHRFTLHHIASDQTPDGCINHLAAEIKAQMKALLAQPRTCAMALTAGYQTRALLACAREWIEEITFFTVDGVGRQTVDAVIASQIAEDHTLKHRVLPRIEATRQQQETYLRRGGHCVADGNMRWHTSLAPLAEDHVFVGGAGAIGQSFFDTNQSRPSVENILGYLGLRATDTMRRHLAFWRAQFEGAETDFIWSRAYMENYLGPCAMANVAATPHIRRYAPFLTYGAVAAIQSLPLHWKTDNRLARTIIQRFWPRLEDYPFNTLGPNTSRSGRTARPNGPTFKRRA